MSLPFIESTGDLQQKEGKRERDSLSSSLEVEVERPLATSSRSYRAHSLWEGDREPQRDGLAFSLIGETEPRT